MNNYNIGQDYQETLGDGTRYFYALRRNADGELYFLRSDQLKDKDAVEINVNGNLDGNLEEFEVGIDYLDGIRADHQIENENLKYPQYRWDSRNVLYYIDSEGNLRIRLNQGYTYPEGISS